jgi:hypothetical protein
LRGDSLRDVTLAPPAIVPFNSRCFDPAGKRCPFPVLDDGDGGGLIGQEWLDLFLATHCWSTIKLDRCSLQFFYRHVLDRPWDWIDIVKPPRVQRLADVLTREETHRLLGAVYKLSCRVFFVTL